jgi:hypothetical protein
VLTVDRIFAEDFERAPQDRSLPWEETRDDVAVVIEPKPYWARDLRVFHMTECQYCYFQDWQELGPAAQFFEHPETCGDDVLLQARAMIARELADGLWDT